MKREGDEEAYDSPPATFFPEGKCIVHITKRDMFCRQIYLRNVDVEKKLNRFLYFKVSKYV